MDLNVKPEEVQKMSDCAPGVDLGCGNLSREKYWKELSDTEKIERMRLIIKSQGREIESLSRLISKIEKRFRFHNHLDSKVVVDIERDNFEYGIGVGKLLPGDDSKGEVYF